MPARFRPHVLGIDDGPFDKRTDERAALVGVMMEGADLVEAVALTEFPVDGEDAARFLAEWVAGLRFASALHGVVLGGVTIAGLGIIDVAELSRRLQLPVMIVNRKRPEDGPLVEALCAAGLGTRTSILERAPGAWETAGGLHVAHVGASREDAEHLLAATLNKSRLPEPLRLAHLIAAAVARGQSRGRP
jgi:endonuclease V-like protein UPF0215 family